MRPIMIAVLVLVCGSPVLLAAEKPALEIRIRSLESVLGKGEELATLLGSAEAIKPVKTLLSAFTNPKTGIAGIDPKKPIGLYVRVTENVVDSPAVLMIPVQDRKVFANVVKEILKAKPGDEESTLVLKPANAPTLHLRFLHEYAYIGRTVEEVSIASLLAPKEFFQEKNPSLLAVDLHIDRIPAEVRKVVFGQLELGTNIFREMKKEYDSEGQQKLRVWALDRLLGMTKAVVDDGKSLSFRLDMKDEEITLDATLVPVAGSELAKKLSGKTISSRGAAAALAVKNPSGVVALRWTLEEEAKKELASVIDDLVRESIDAAAEDDQEGRRLVFDALLPTLKSGELDLGLAITGPDNENHIGLLFAVRTVEGSEIITTAKSIVSLLPETAGFFDFDRKKVHGLSLHDLKLDLPELDRKFGTKTLRIASDDGLFLFSADAEAKAIEKAAATGEKECRIATIDVRLSDVLRGIAEKKDEKKFRQAHSTAFGKGAAGERDRLRFTLEGGETLSAKVSVKAKTLQFVTAIGAAEKK